MIIKPEDLELTSKYLLLEEYEPDTEGVSFGTTLEDKPFFGKVIEVNENYGTATLYPKGSILMFSMHSTTRISINSKTYFLILAEDIIATVKEKTD